jgi:hypothetical protein
MNEREGSASRQATSRVRDFRMARALGVNGVRNLVRCRAEGEEVDGVNATYMIQHGLAMLTILAVQLMKQVVTPHVAKLGGCT